MDIAGFTVLSQRLDVESLKNNINNYFTRMLGIIDKWGGGQLHYPVLSLIFCVTNIFLSLMIDVVKFAGDALYGIVFSLLC